MKRDTALRLSELEAKVKDLEDRIVVLESVEGCLAYLLLDKTTTVEGSQTSPEVSG
jgi:hypothetical protein